MCQLGTICANQIPTTWPPSTSTWHGVHRKQNNRIFYLLLLRRYGDALWMKLHCKMVFLYVIRFYRVNCHCTIAPYPTLQRSLRCATALATQHLITSPMCNLVASSLIQHSIFYTENCQFHRDIIIMYTKFRQIPVKSDLRC